MSKVKELRTTTDLVKSILEDGQLHGMMICFYIIEFATR